MKAESLNKDLSLLTPLQRLEKLQCAQYTYEIVFELLHELYISFYIYNFTFYLPSFLNF